MKTFFFFKILRLLLITAFVLTVIFVVHKSLTSTKSKVNLNQASVITEIQSLNRLETASFTIEKIIEAGTRGNAFQNILYGNKILLIAHAEIIAGVDLSKLTTDDVKVSGTTLTITLPAPEILVSKLDNDKTRVYDRQSGIFSPYDKDLESEARAQAEQSIRQAACEGGILTIASENAIKQFQTIFLTAGFEKVNVSTETQICE